MEWPQTWFGLVIGFIEHLQFVTASNYSTIAKSLTLQFNSVRTKSSQCPSLPCPRSKLASFASDCRLKTKLHHSQAGIHVTPITELPQEYSVVIAATPLVSAQTSQKTQSPNSFSIGGSQTTVALQQRNGVFFVVRDQMFEAGQKV
jgi:hypothetical protein